MVLSVLINGVSYRCANTYEISQQAGAVSSSNIDILVEAQPVPQTMSTVTISADGMPFFSGIVQSVESPEYSSGKEVTRYRLSIQSKDVIFNNRLVSEAFANKYTHEIIQTLFDNYISQEGIALGEISVSEQFYKNYNCSFTVLREVLTELAEDINASYYVSADDKFYFVTRDAFDQMDAPEHITGLKIEEENGDLRTVQIVTGASEETSTQTASTYWTAGQSAMLLGYQIKSLSGMTINGTLAGVGKLGVDDDDTSNTFLYALGEGVITLNLNATVQPSAGDLIVVVYKGYYEIIVTNTNDSLKGQISALNGTSGIIEQILTDETIDNFADADAKANSLLSQYGEREQTISCSCTSLADSPLYRLWVFNNPDLGIVGQYVITERSLSAFGENMWSRIKLKNKNYFARYGSVLVNSTKTKGENVKVYKNTNISDSITITDSVVFESAGLAYWPTESDFMDTMLDGFYPG